MNALSNKKTLCRFTTHRSAEIVESESQTKRFVFFPYPENNIYLDAIVGKSSLESK